MLVMGNSKCGKTSIIKRYTENQFDTKYNITIGADYSKKVVSHEGELVRLQLWDIAGQDRFVHLTRPFYQKAKAAAIVCDVTRPVTLNAVRAWKKDLDEKMGEGTLPVVVIANKCDLLKGIPEAMKLGAQIESLCSELKVNKWFIASAKIDENVDNAMAYLVSELMQNPDKADNDDQRLESSGSVIKLGSLADNHNYNNQPTNYGACCYGAG